MADHLEQPEPAGPTTTASAWPSWALLLLTVLLGASYLLVLDVPFLRETGLPATVLMPLAALAVVWRLRRRRSIGLLLPAVLAVGLTGFFLVGTFGLTLPDAQATPDAGAIAADFTLPDHTGRDVTLSRAWKQGPLLLVFYRGHW